MYIDYFEPQEGNRNIAKYFSRRNFTCGKSEKIYIKATFTNDRFKWYRSHVQEKHKSQTNLSQANTMDKVHDYMATVNLP